MGGVEVRTSFLSEVDGAMVARLAVLKVVR